MSERIMVLVDVERIRGATLLLKDIKRLFPHAEIHAVYVMPFGFYSYIEPYVNKDTETAAIEQVKKQLRELISGAGLLDEVIPHVLKGGIGEQAVLMAKKIQADMVAVKATRRDSEHTTLGTHAAQIARHAPCSVFIYREPGDA